MSLCAWEELQRTETKMGQRGFHSNLFKIVLPCAGACASEKLTVQVLMRLYIEFDGYKLDFVYFVCAGARTTMVLCEVCRQCFCLHTHIYTHPHEHTYFQPFGVNPCPFLLLHDFNAVSMICMQISVKNVSDLQNTVHWSKDAFHALHLGLVTFSRPGAV